MAFATAKTPQELQAIYAEEAKIAVSDFSTERGETLYFQKTKDWTCATCHTDNPINKGKHTITNRAIKPLSPSVNNARFTRLSKTEKWFKRNCKEVVGRECTATEKGDFIAYVLSIK